MRIFKRTFNWKKHIVFLKMSKDLSVKYETKIRAQKYERKMWKPFDGIVVIEMAKKSLIFALERIF